MAWRYTIVPRLLHFKEPAGTSRGVYTDRPVWYVVLRDDKRWGVGECAPLHDLSVDAGPDYFERLEACCQRFCETGNVDVAVPADCPSMRFGLETALCQLKAGSLRFFDTAFSRGEEDVPINGLVWMGDHDQMLKRMEAKLAQGFHCLKFKIGGIDFESECDLIRRVRERYPNPEDLEIRLDANGSFTPGNALERLEILAQFKPHSLEQPIRQGQWPVMSELCAVSPVPLALDEELIGLTGDAREDMMAVIRPAYLVLKPSLHGGMKGCEEWMALAEKYGSRTWVTSALESNIGLNAIAQWRAKFPCDLPQGLGTGQLFTDNCDSMPTAMRGAAVHCDPARPEPDLLTWLGLPSSR